MGREAGIGGPRGHPVGLVPDRDGLGQSEGKGHDPLDLRQHLSGRQAAGGHERGDLPGNVGAGEHRPTLAHDPDRSEPPRHILRGRLSHHSRRLAGAGAVGAERCWPVTPSRPGDTFGKGLGKGPVGEIVMPRSGFDPGAGRSGPDGGQDLVAAEPGLLGLGDPVLVERRQLRVLLTGSGLQDRGPDHTHPLSRRESPAQEFFVLGDLRTGCLFNLALRT